MLFFGHIGIAVGTMVGLDRGDSWRRTKAPDSHRLAKLSAALACVDYRLLVIGSMLPDIIDKPIGNYIFRDTFQNGRNFAHTLLFLALLLALGFWRYRRAARTGVLVLAFGSLMHVLCDGMWKDSETLFWPAFGFDFPKNDPIDFWHVMWEKLTHKPSAFVPELIGVALLAPVGLVLLMNGRLVRFLKYGSLK